MPPQFSIVLPPAPGNAIVPTPPTPAEGGPPSLLTPPPTSAAGGAARPLDWRWVAALLFLWLGLTAMYELGLPQLANGFALVIAGSAVMLLGPAAVAEILKLIGAS